MGEGRVWPSSPGLGEEVRWLAFQTGSQIPKVFLLPCLYFLLSMWPSPQATPWQQVACVQVPQSRGRETPFQLEKCKWVETALFFLQVFWDKEVSTKTGKAQGRLVRPWRGLKDSRGEDSTEASLYLCCPCYPQSTAA